MDEKLIGKPVAVIGATGHTARFVIDELEQWKMEPVLIGRDASTLATLRVVHGAREVRVARFDDARSLDAALLGTAAAINCAGPFLDTALPVAEAAVRGGIPYLDLAAEQAAVQLLEPLDDDARRAGTIVVPGVAFFGALADLLACSIADSSDDVNVIRVAIALDHWHPTAGTRRTGARNTVPRVIARSGILIPMPQPAPGGVWTFHAPFGAQDVVMLPFSETLTLLRRFRRASIESWIGANALADVAHAATPAPEPIDERGRSAQLFMMDVDVETKHRRLRATARGQDIYATSATIIVEALKWILTGKSAPGSGVCSLSQIVEPRAFIEALVRDGHLHVDFAEAS